MFNIPISMLFFTAGHPTLFSPQEEKLLVNVDFLYTMELCMLAKEYLNKQGRHCVEDSTA